MVDLTLLKPSFSVDGHLRSSLDNCRSNSLQVGKQVAFVLNRKVRVGVLKFIGPTNFSNGEWCGIELSEPCGKNNGSVEGVRYFECDENCGIFVHSHKVKELDKIVFKNIRDPDDNLMYDSSNSTTTEDCKSSPVGQAVSMTSNGNCDGSEFVSKSFESNIIEPSSGTNFVLMNAKQSTNSGKIECSSAIKTDIYSINTERNLLNKSLSYRKMSFGEICFVPDRGRQRMKHHGSCPNLPVTTSEQVFQTEANETNGVEKQEKNWEHLSERIRNGEGTLHKNCNDKAVEQHMKLISASTEILNRSFGELTELNKTMSLNSFFTKIQCFDSANKSFKLLNNFLSEKSCSCPSSLDILAKTTSVKNNFDLRSSENILRVVDSCKTPKSDFQLRLVDQQTSYPQGHSTCCEKISKSKTHSATPSPHILQPPGMSLSLPKLNVGSSENLFTEGSSAFHDSKTSSWPDFVKVKRLPQITYRSTDDEDDEYSVFPSKPRSNSVELEDDLNKLNSQNSFQISDNSQGSTGGKNVNGCLSPRGQGSNIDNCYSEEMQSHQNSESEQSGLSSRESLHAEEQEIAENERISYEKPPQGKKCVPTKNGFSPKAKDFSRFQSQPVKTFTSKREEKIALAKPVQNKKDLEGKKYEQNQQSFRKGLTNVISKVKKPVPASAIPAPFKASNIVNMQSSNSKPVNVTHDSENGSKITEQATTKLSHIPHLMKKIPSQPISEVHKPQEKKAFKRNVKDEKKSAISKQSKATPAVEKTFSLQKNTSATPKGIKRDIPKPSKTTGSPSCKGPSKMTADKVITQTPKTKSVQAVKSSSFKMNREQLPKTKMSSDISTQKTSVSKQGSSFSGLEKDTCKTALKSASVGSVGKVTAKSKLTNDVKQGAGGTLRAPKPIAGKKTASTLTKGTDKKTKLSQDARPTSVAKSFAQPATKQAKRSVGFGKPSSKLQPPSKLSPHVIESASTSSFDGADFISGLGSDIDSASVNTDLSEDIQGLLHTHSVSPEPEERDFNEEFPFLGSHTLVKADIDSGCIVKPIPWTKSVAAPDILSEISTQRNSVEVQTETEDDARVLVDLQNRATCMEELYKRKREECIKLDAELEYRNWELIGIAILVETFLCQLQHAARQVGHLEKKLSSNEDELKRITEKCLEEEEENVKLQTEMMYVRSEHAVAMETLKADHDKILEKMKFTLQMKHTEEMTLAAEAHMAKLQDLQKQKDLEVSKVKDEHEKLIADVKEQYNDELVEVESKHSHAIEEILEEHQVEIETIKSDYEEETAQLRKRYESLNSECTSLKAKLRQVEEDVQKEVESKIESAVSMYKSLPDELESLKVVLELKNEEIKQLRNENVETKMELDHLRGIGNRIRKLEHENESLSFVVENKSKMERQISVERDSLRNTLEREVKKVKRLSLENEELQWRLFHSPSPQPGIDSSENSMDNSRMNRLSTCSVDPSLPSTINE